ncbi:MAG: RecB family exonuclease [Patescibacteria group bacterium]
MSDDKFSAVWVSHTSISDFLKCPRAYYLKNVYKDPKTKHKVQLMSPSLALGQVVHEVLENLSNLPTQDRFKQSLVEKFDISWKKISGRRGGFSNESQEQSFKKRGEEMMRKIINDPGPLARLAVKITEDLPHYWLSQEQNIILCGKIDWLEYLPKTDSVRIIDFKTSKTEENDGSLQLPIYNLLVNNTQKRRVDGLAYWYLDLNVGMVDKQLPTLEESQEKVLTIAKQIKLARQLNRFRCPQGEAGCYACRPFEKIIKGEAEFVGNNQYNQDIYILRNQDNPTNDSVLL